jgi:hypothetical protein
MAALEHFAICPEVVHLRNHILLGAHLSLALPLIDLELLDRCIHVQNAL